MIIRRTSRSRSTALREAPHAASVHSVLAALAAIATLAVGSLAVPSATHAADSSPALSGVVNLNTASTDELQLRPGVGEVRAVAIVSARKDRGGFKQVDDLLDVKGIGPAMLQKLRPFVTLSGKTTARKL